MEGAIRVLIVDDHNLVRQGLAAMLRAHEGFSVVGEAENGREAVRKAKELMPDVVLMDIAMPLLNGIEATRQIRHAAPEVKVLVLSMYTEGEHVFQALKAGATGYVVKDADIAELLSAIRSVNGGNTFFSPVISRKIMESYLSEDEDKKPGAATDHLTNREKEVLQLICEGYTNNEIAGLMKISVKTVETHRSHIMGKLDIHEVTGLIKYAIKKGIIVL